MRKRPEDIPVQYYSRGILVVNVLTLAVAVLSLVVAVAVFVRG